MIALSSPSCTRANAVTNDHYSNGLMQVWDARTRGLIYGRAQVSSNEKGCLSRFLTSYTGGSCRRFALIQPFAPDRGYLFWPATGYWRRPDGSHGGGGAGKLIEEMRRASSSQGPGRSVKYDALAPQHYKVVTFFLATMPSQTR
jgi:hypothetical protein